ncbi:MAG: ArsR/SmtB family transcription factor [Hasllibacter sp.]
MTPAPDLDAIFAALADPTRRAILAQLLEDDMAVTDVAAAYRISLAAVSKHLAVLGRAGLVARERRGRVSWCKLEPDALRAAGAWMAGLGGFEGLDLDAFERFLEAEMPGAQDAPGVVSEQVDDGHDDHDQPDDDQDGPHLRRSRRG